MPRKRTNVDAAGVVAHRDEDMPQGGIGCRHGADEDRAPLNSSKCVAHEVPHHAHHAAHVAHHIVRHRALHVYLHILPALSHVQRVHHLAHTRTKRKLAFSAQTSLARVGVHQTGRSSLVG